MDIDPLNILIAHNQSGEAYIGFSTVAEVTAALTKNREIFGKRYVELFRGNTVEMYGYNFALSFSHSII